ncbi:hypothetical protein, partial [Burkholderia cenocepacia]|uniref:hypothetical protein n=1 Tax=Burkholderia cenocepacia TaxID=95486 RepID=UPI001C4E10AB
ESRPLRQKMKKPASCGLFHLHRSSCLPFAPHHACYIAHRVLREIRDCIRTRLRYRGGMRF